MRPLLTVNQVPSGYNANAGYPLIVDFGESSLQTVVRMSLTFTNVIAVRITKQLHIRTSSRSRS